MSNLTFSPSGAVPPAFKMSDTASILRQNVSTVIKKYLFQALDAGYATFTQDLAFVFIGIAIGICACKVFQLAHKSIFEARGFRNSRSTSEAVMIEKYDVDEKVPPSTTPTTCFSGVQASAPTTFAESHTSENVVTETSEHERFSTASSCSTVRISCTCGNWAKTSAIKISFSRIEVAAQEPLIPPPTPIIRPQLTKEQQLAQYEKRFKALVLEMKAIFSLGLNPEVTAQLGHIDTPKQRLLWCVRYLDYMNPWTGELICERDVLGELDSVRLVDITEGYGD